MNGVLIGSVSSSAAALRGLLRGGLPMAAVCGLDAQHAAGVSDFVDLAPLARDAGVSYVPFRKVTEPQVEAVLRDIRPDWLFVIGLSQLVPAGLRDLARLGAIGFHPTPLPEGRGRAPVAWTILLNRPAAANLFFLVDEPDAGDIIAQRPVPVYPDDYAADLIARTNDVLEAMTAELAPAFRSGNVPRTPQDHTHATYYPRRRPEDGRIDWNAPAADVHRLIRAVSRPYPGAFTTLGSTTLTIWRATLLLDDAGAAAEPPGTIVDLRNGRPIIQANGGRIEVTDMEQSAPAELRVGVRLGTEAPSGGMHN